MTSDDNDAHTTHKVSIRTVTAHDSATTTRAVWTHARLTHELATRWCFWPYPRCTRRQLEHIDVYVIATADDSDDHNDDDACRDARLRDADGDDDDDDAHTMQLPPLLGVVGVVWVALSASAASAATTTTTTTTSTSCRVVEGYVQVVLVSPSHRRRGIATRLLRAMLTHRNRYTSCTRPGLGDDHNDRDSHTRDDDVVTAHMVIARWRLHTMHTTQRTRQYLRDTPPPPRCDDDDHNDNARDGNDTHTRDVATAAAVASIDAVVRLYEQLGFVRRRALPRYYGGAADAIEMVKHVDGARKASERRS